MKSKKIALDAVQKGTLSEKVHTTELKQRLKEMAKKHNNETLTTDFFLSTSHCFEEEKEGLLLVLGETKSTWKQYKKQVLKNQKKSVLMGKCFLENSSGKDPILHLIPSNGQASSTRIKRAGKALFKKYKFSCNFFQPIPKEEEADSIPSVAPKEAIKNLVTAFQAVGQSSNKLAQLLVVANLLEKAKLSLDKTPIEDKKEADKLKATLQQITNKMQPHQATLVEKKALLQNKFIDLLKDFNQSSSNDNLVFTLPSSNQ